MAAAIAGVGFVLADRGKERLAILLQLRQMVYYLKSQILYSNATLPEAVFEVGTHFQTSKKEGKSDWEPAVFFLHVSKMLDGTGKHLFSEVWKEETGEIPPHIPLSQSDRQSLEALGRNLGYADRSMQERSLLFYLEQLDGTVDGLKAETGNLEKLYRTLGVAAGMFWFVLLI